MRKLPGDPPGSWFYLQAGDGREKNGRDYDEEHYGTR